jgi:outer membrane receptor protein involved in Fe transport
MIAMPLRLAGLGVGAALMLACMPTVTAASAGFRGMSLEQALATLEERGLALVYSSALVQPWMRIRTEPAATDPEALLAELLAPFGLHGRSGPGGVIAIVRAAPSHPSGTESRKPAETRPAQTSALVPLEEIIVAASRYELTRSFSVPSGAFTGTDIENLPDLGDDALRAIARLPGAATNGLTARLNVRGGEAGETLVRFDGMRLYNPFHLKDFQSVFSAVDPRIVDSVDVYTGGFAARFGDRMSGVVDIRSLQAPGPRYRELNVTFFNTSALSSGRFADGRGEWVGSIRRSNMDLWYHALSEEPGTPTYSDAFGKLSYDLNDRMRLTAGTLYFADEVSLSVEDRDERANAEYADRYYWLRLDHEPNSFVSGTTLFGRAELRSDRSGSTDLEGLGSGNVTDRRSVSVDSLQSDWSWHASERYLVQFGGELRRAKGVYDYQDEMEFDLLFDTPGAPNATERARSIHVEPHKNDYSLYGTLRYGVTPRLTSDVGFRWESGRVSPRVGMRFQVREWTFLRASWGRVYQSQGIDELQVADGVTEFFPAQQADHASLGLEHRFSSGIGLRVEAYNKRLSHLRPRFENLLNPLTLVPELRPDRVELAPSRASARGVEIVLSQKDAGALSWWLGYSLSAAKERLAGVETRRSWDQTHAVSAGLNWNTEKWNVGVAMIQRSGWPTTDVALEDGGEVPIVTTGPRNAIRSDVYRAVDLRIARRFALEHSSLSVFLEVANLFDRDNPCCISYELDDESAGLELERRNSVPRIPSLGVLWQF